MKSSAPIANAIRLSATRGQLSPTLFVEVVLKDITKEKVDAITNAANGSLSHGGGVAGAIVRAGGFKIQHESTALVRKMGQIPVGKCAITGAGSLQAKYIIHAVGPVWSKSKGKKWNVDMLYSAVY